MSRTDLRELLQRYQQGSCTAEEKRIVEDWYHALGHERELHVTPEERETIRQALWNRIAEQTADLEEEPEDRAWFRAPAARWAAAAMLALGLGLGARQLWPVPARQTVGPPATAPTRWVVYPNTSQQVVSIMLPDSSLVQLAPASQLKYPRRFGAKYRPVYLVGKAFFEVRRDTTRPFQVYTAQVLTTVLGTSFSVQAYKGQKDAVVEVKTGRVRVTPRVAANAPPPKALPAPIVVLPNQQAVYSPERQLLARELVAQPVQLKPQSFVFDDRPVTEVLASLEKAYGVHIVYDAKALANCTVTLVLRKQSLYGKLEVLCKTLGASYEEENAQILFHGPGCQGS
ncbi:FecR family protein [Hymenobacter sp.]|jgi:ferric-dicitrate binding protein FerR (iron transport regulator)|uniref:FecR family protein n=1 Tax=Hymenobacter sp. TaxID=1898978 RepID=UPI002ED8D9E0